MHVALKETMDVFYTSPREKQRGMLAKKIVPMSGKNEFNCVFVTAVVAQLAHEAILPTFRISRVLSSCGLDRETREQVHQVRQRHTKGLINSLV